MTTVKEIYQAIHTLFPFHTQENWDNSGLLVGSGTMPASKIYVTLDISKAAIARAAAWGADVILSHHPVIFSPMRTIGTESPVWDLISHQMAAICVHTPLDRAEGGINDTLYSLLKTPLTLRGERCKESHTGDVGFGWMDTSETAWTAEALAKQLSTALNCPNVRYIAAEKPIHKIYVGCGSCASMLEEAAAMGCDAMITGDVKHDRWYAAEALGVALFDCGHFHTEKIAIFLLAEAIRQQISGVEVLEDTTGDPVCYMTGDENL